MKLKNNIITFKFKNNHDALFVKDKMAELIKRHFPGIKPENSLYTEILKMMILMSLETK